MLKRDFDVVVIGSGAGGGTAAQELAPLCAQGLRVAVIERGPRLREEEYTGCEREMARRLYHDDGGFLTRDRAMTLAFAHAYGGSTVVYTGTSMFMRRPDLERWGLPELSWDDLNRRARRHLDDNGAALLPEDELNENNTLFRDACERLGWDAFQFPVNVRGCTGAGVCNLGCLGGAKQGTHRVQLPKAERSGVVIVSNARAARVSPEGVEVEVSPASVGYQSAWEPGRYLVRARVVVVAAGAVESPALLLRSGLGRGLPALGRYFTTQPAVIVAGRHSRPITNYHGHPKSFCCDHFRDTEGFLLETCMYFPTVAAKSLAGFGVEHREMMGALDRLQMILAFSLDEARPDNRVLLGRDGEPVVDYRLTPEVLRSLRAACEASASILFESGCDRVHTPVGPRFGVTREAWERAGRRLEGELLPGTAPVAGAHLMGGCRMGRGPDDSVTDSWGQVHGQPWLFVADASLFPDAARINPYPTIMALADRVAERVRGRLRELVT